MATRSSRLALGTLHAQRSPVGATVRGGGLSQSRTRRSSSTDVSFSILVDSEKERLWWFESVALKQIHYHMLTKTSCKIPLWLNFPGLSLFVFLIFLVRRKYRYVLSWGWFSLLLGVYSVIAYYLLIYDINYINNHYNKLI